MLQLRGDPLARIVALRARYGGFVRLGPLRSSDVFLVTDPAAIRHVLLDHHRNYVKGLAARRLRPVLGQGSLLLEGDAWRQRRRLIQPAFHKQKVAGLTAAFIEETDATIERWRSTIDRGGELDARNEMLALTMRLTLRNMFGGEATELAALVEAWQVIYDDLSARRLRLVRRPTWMPDQQRDRISAAMATVHRVLSGLIRDHQPGEDRTVLAMLLQARGADADGGLSDDELRDEILTIFIGGYETSSNALAFTLALLARYPEVARRHHQELAEVLQGRAPEVTDLAALPYNRAVLDEALRLYPPSWMITREAVVEDSITAGRRGASFPVPRGSQLLISAYGVHHAPELWPEPERFRPERFLPGAPERDRFAYLPFGGGPRVCLGDVYAMTEMQLILARVAQQLSLRPGAGCQIEAQAHVGLRPRHPLRLVGRWR
jgi:cytochrome P450